MISEKRLAQDYVSFWQQLLPMSEFVVRQMNLQLLERYSAPIGIVSDPNRRGLVNEAAFFVFRSHEILKKRKLSAEEYLEVESSARRRIALLERRPPSEISELLEVERREVLFLADAIHEFFDKNLAGISVVVNPKFNGCGILDACYGDVFAGGGLFEFKAGSRQFRSVDFRQVLIYCALNYSARAYEIETVGLVNPRQGTYIWITIEDLVNRFCGLKPMQLFEEILQYVSSGGISK